MKTKVVISTGSRRVASCRICRNLRSMKMLTGIHVGSAPLKTPIVSRREDVANTDSEFGGTIRSVCKAWVLKDDFSG